VQSSSNAYRRNWTTQLPPVNLASIVSSCKLYSSMCVLTHPP